MLALSGDLPIGTASFPGAGMMPKMLAGSARCAWARARAARAGKPDLSSLTWQDLPHAARVTAITAVAVLMYQIAGFLLTMGVLLFALIFGVERRAARAGGRVQPGRGRADLSVIQLRPQDAAPAEPFRVLGWAIGQVMSATLDSLLLGFSVALQPDVLWYAFLGCLVGTVVGVLPGIGPLSGISILLPATFGLDTTKSVVMLAGIYYGSQYGGSTTSILMRIPGEASSVMTCIDGYAMAQKGRAGAALCIAAVGSWIAGTFGVVMLTLIAPPLADLCAALRAAGIYRAPGARPDLPGVHVIDVAAAHTADGMRRAAARHHRHRQHDRPFPLFLRHCRARGRHRHRAGGRRLVRAGRNPVDPVGSVVREVIAPRLRQLLPNREEWRQSAMPIARGSVLGFLIGLTPGSAHIISSFLSYAVERRLSRHPEEFGKGAVAGVAGPESANNAASTGAFVPMLALGLPTGPITAVLLAALMIHGVPPGPTLVNDHPDMFWGFVASMYVGNLMLLALNLPLVGIFVNVLRIPYAYLYPLVIMFCIIGVYEVSHSIVDVWIMLIMGVVGYGLRKFGLDPAPLVLGLVISPTLEMSLRQSLIMSNGNWTIFFQRPIAIVLLRICVVLLALAALSLIRSRKDWRGRLAEAEAGEPG